MCSIASLAVSTEVYGEFELSLTDSAGNSATIDSSGAHFTNDAGGTGSFSPGDISFSGNVGAFNVVPNLEAFSIRGGTFGAMSLFADISAPAGTSTSLTISLTDTDFPKTSVGVDSFTAAGLVTGGYATGQAWFSPGSVPMTGLYESLGTFTGKFDLAVSSPFGFGQVAYSELVQFVLTPQSSKEPYTFDIEQTGAHVNQSVPEPSTLVMWSILVGMFGVIRGSKYLKRLAAG